MLRLLPIALATASFAYGCKGWSSSGEQSGAIGPDPVARQGAGVRTVAAMEAECGSNVAKACGDLAAVYADGVGVAPEPARAAALFQRACDGDDYNACARLADLLRSGSAAIPRNEDRARQLLGRACTGGVASACTRQATMLMSGPTGRNAVRAAELLQKACDGGDPEGCVQLGEAYEKGRGVVESYGESLELFDKACTAGSPSGCRLLGVMYAEGRGVARSPTRSADLWTRACDGRDALACVELARAYANGRGVRADRARAASLFRKACDAGVAIACDPDRASKSDKPATPGG
jgi:TPR repeat protein